MQFFPIAVFFGFFVSQISSQCTASDNTRCVNWVRNGFCQSSFYTSAQKRQYCGNACGLCSSSSCVVDANANCVKWAAAGKCSVSAVKTFYCCATCKTATTGSSTTTSTASTTTTTK